MEVNLKEYKYLYMRMITEEEADEDVSWETQRAFGDGNHF